MIIDSILLTGKLKLSSLTLPFIGKMKACFSIRTGRKSNCQFTGIEFQAQSRPENLQEMINTAEKLGERIDFVRVDLYNTTRGVVLGEMTIYPEAGMLNRPTVDKFFNNWLGDQWILPESTYY